ncbi:MAG: hypothetical protein JNL39_09765 [Opitutaceae bacterium]|nr:hypothetical protein [Opitutaceae bacterium]
MLAGAVDFHCHTGPDTGPRSMNSLAAVRQLHAAGVRAVVLKHHFMPTSALAQLAREEVGGIEVFGGVVLNRAAGGINAEAVRRMAQVTGKRGRVVWLPTFDAEHQVRIGQEIRPAVAVVRDGRPVPEMADVFQAIAENDLVLATGHSAPEESLVLLEAARRAGLRRLLVTHALTPRWRVNGAQMRTMAALGAVLELIWHNHMPRPPPAPGRPPAAAPMPIAVAVDAIRAVGAEHFLISSDLGQAGSPPHADGLRAFAAALRAGGLDDREIDLVLRKNPARLLGLD